MPDLKEMSFILIILLVSVSAVYEWIQTDDDLNKQFGVSSPLDFRSGTLTATLNTFQLAVDNLIQSLLIADLIGFLASLQAFFTSAFQIFMKLMFGWTNIVDSIFDAMDLSSLRIIFTGPLVIIQILGSFYFLRDLVNTLRGVR